MSCWSWHFCGSIGPGAEARPADVEAALFDFPTRAVRAAQAEPPTRRIPKKQMYKPASAECLFMECSIFLMLLGPTIWVGVLHHAQPLFPYQYPTVVSLPCAVLVLVVVSMLDKSASAHEARLAFDRLHLRALTGIEPNPGAYRNESISSGASEEK